jgi:5'-3' exoribonuclease 1
VTFADHLIQVNIIYLDLLSTSLSLALRDTVAAMEKFADPCTATKSSAIKKAIVKGIQPQAILKPSHDIYRLQNQLECFTLGDRVTMVQDSGGVPLSVKGVVIGLNTKSIDVT